MDSLEIDWTKKHVLKTTGSSNFFSDEISPADALKKRKDVEPWLAAILQSEHLALLLGSGLTNAVCFPAGVTPQDMGRLALSHKYGGNIRSRADMSAKDVGRGDANIEDDIRVANELIA